MAVSVFVEHHSVFLVGTPYLPPYGVYMLRKQTFVRISGVNGEIKRLCNLLFFIFVSKLILGVKCSCSGKSSGRSTVNDSSKSPAVASQSKNKRQRQKASRHQEDVVVPKITGKEVCYVTI